MSRNNAGLIGLARGVRFRSLMMRLVMVPKEVPLVVLSAGARQWRGCSAEGFDTAMAVRPEVTTLAAPGPPAPIERLRSNPSRAPDAQPHHRIYLATGPRPPA